MSKRVRQSAKNQPSVIVVRQAQDAAADTVWFVTPAAAFAGVSYFWGYYYFGDNLWRVLSGG